MFEKKMGVKTQDVIAHRARDDAMISLQPCLSVFRFQLVAISHHLSHKPDD